MRKAILAISSCFVVACGGGSDPAPIDETPQPGDATVTVNSNGTGIEGVLVAFNNPDGTINTTGETNADGSVTAFIEPGSIVTVGSYTPPSGAPPTTILQTIFDVNPADTIVVDPENVPGSTSTDLGDAQITVPAAFSPPAFGGGGAVDNYYLESPCQSMAVTPAQVVVIPVTSNCVGKNGKLTVMVSARNSSNQRLAFSLAKNITPVPSGMATVNLTTWSQNFDEFDLTISNFPPGSSPQAAAIEVVGRGQGTYMTAVPFSPTEYVTPHGWADSNVIEYATQYSQSDAQIRLINQAPFTADFDFNIAANIPGRVIGTDVLTALGNKQPAITVFTSGDMTTLDGFASCLAWQNAPIKTLGSSATGLWFFVAPAGMTTVQAPELPSEFNGMLPATDSYFQGNASATFIGDSRYDYTGFKNTVNSQAVLLLPLIADFSAIEQTDIALYSPDNGCPSLF